MITVEVQLFGALQRDRFKKADVVLADNATIEQALSKLEISRDEVGILVVNRKDATFDQELANGDRVTIIPFISGG